MEAISLYINVTVHILYQVNFDLTQFDYQFPLTASLSKQGNQGSTLNKKIQPRTNLTCRIYIKIYFNVAIYLTTSLFLRKWSKQDQTMRTHPD